MIANSTQMAGLGCVSASEKGVAAMIELPEEDVQGLLDALDNANKELAETATLTKRLHAERVLLTAALQNYARGLSDGGNLARRELAAAIRLRSSAQ